MWCTRWFLPLLLLPLPTASPYFLLLFLFSLTINAKPCFYCIVLLTTIFVSSCYWQPLPLDSPLSRPWADNITTFAEALNSTLTVSPKKPIPDTIRTMDRCWCDLSYNVMFEPFNVTRWEYLSVMRLKNDLEREPVRVSIDTSNGTILTGSSSESNATVANPTPFQLPSWKTLISNYRRTVRKVVQDFFPDRSQEPAAPSSASPPAETPIAPVEPEEVSQGDLPPLRQKYDLRPYGLGMIIDFGWTR